MILEYTATIDAEMTGANGIAFRRARVEDANTIARHRESMFRDMGYHDGAHLHSMRHRFLPWVEAKLRSGDYLGWLAVDEDDRAVAGAGLWLMEWPPHMVSSGSRRGNILNVYTEPAFRRQGLARSLVEAALHACKVNNVDFVILHTSKEGRRLYEQLGFEAGNEMRIRV
jgi:ribosomal protein S18 acetylase RimI-like enzyme